MFLDNLVESLGRSIGRYDEALGYLRSRLVADEEIKKYGIGYTKVLSVPDDGSSDRKRFMEESRNGRKFEGKIVFPLRDPLGRVVGIAGRNVATKEFKNFITEEAKFTGFFFGLCEALPEIYRRNTVFVVEGYFDLLAYQKVFPNTVAALTANLSDAQYELLTMYCDRIVTVFDSDEAGRKGTEEAMKRKNVLSLDLGYKDPAHGLETLQIEGFKEYVLKRSRSVPFL